jgi:hypothetical protein
MIPSCWRTLKTAAGGARSRSSTAYPWPWTRGELVGGRADQADDTAGRCRGSSRRVRRSFLRASAHGDSRASTAAGGPRRSDLPGSTAAPATIRRTSAHGRIAGLRRRMRAAGRGPAPRLGLIQPRHRHPLGSPARSSASPWPAPWSTGPGSCCRRAHWQSRQPCRAVRRGEPGRAGGSCGSAVVVATHDVRIASPASRRIKIRRDDHD